MELQVNALLLLLDQRVSTGQVMELVYLTILKKSPELLEKKSPRRIVGYCAVV